MGSGWPLRQSRVILPTITRRRCFSRTMSMISQSCCVLLARRETSNTVDGIPCACLGEHGLLLALYLCVPMFVFHEDFFGSCGLQLPHLPVDVLFRLVSGTSGIAINHFLLSFWRRGECPAHCVYILMEKRRLETCLV